MEIRPPLYQSSIFAIYGSIPVVLDMNINDVQFCFVHIMR